MPERKAQFRLNFSFRAFVCGSLVFATDLLAIMAIDAKRMRLLHDCGSLELAIRILGPGNNLLIAGVCKDWQLALQRVAESEKDPLQAASWFSTSYSAIFASTALVRLARQARLEMSNDGVRRVAGRVVNLPTLQIAHGLGLSLTDSVIEGAAETGSMQKVFWIHNQRSVTSLPKHIGNYAASSGNVKLMEWLRQRRVVFDAQTAVAAAAAGKIDVLRYLRSVGCEMDEISCDMAAYYKHLDVLKYLKAVGCEWDEREIGAAAAGGGSMEIMLYLQQWGIKFNEATFASAAQAGRMYMLEFLLQQQCPFDARACDDAARAGNCDVLLWLRQHGCDWDTTDIHISATESGCTDVMQFVIEHGAVTTAAQLTEMLCAAAENGLLAAAQWLRKHHRAEWPGVLQDDEGYPWERKLVRWVRLEGCTSPVE
jgi:hypothetical protein